MWLVAIVLGSDKISVITENSWTTFLYGSVTMDMSSCNLKTSISKNHKKLHVLFFLLIFNKKTLNCRAFQFYILAEFFF